MKHALVMVLGGLLLMGGMSPTASAQAPKKHKQGASLKVKILQPGRVYYPKGTHAKSFKKVGLISCATVLYATKEYKKIARKGVRRGTAEYSLLIKRASDRFKKAVRTTVSLGGYDLIAETGAVTVAGKSLPDITSEVVRNLLKN